MWQDKKFLVIIGLIVVLIAAVGTIGGIYLARQNNALQVRQQLPDGLHRVTIVLPENKGTTNWQEALDNYLQKLVDDGKITQEEANQFKTWWESRPDIPGIFDRIMHDGIFFFSPARIGN
jgi:hypothetical protein